MKVFITGGTGYLGSVLVEHLTRAGHDVMALARSDASAQRLLDAGATPISGTLSDTATLSREAAAADAVIHAAVDYSMTEQTNRIELDAVAALTDGAGAANTGKPVIFTSTGLVYGFAPDRDQAEDAELPERSAQPVKVAAERIVLGAAGITGTVIRAGLIFGRGGSGLVTGLIQSATATGVSTYIDEGTNSWMPVHVDDLADLYIKAVERPVAGIFNAAGTVPFTFRELAEAIADLTGASVTSIPFAIAVERFGPFAHVLTSTGGLIAVKACTTFGWQPSTRSLVDDVRFGSYSNRAEAASSDR
jgi:nucleoside-diphosphate-sugar epimerase